LLIASQRGHYDVVKCLLRNGADINLRDEGGLSPLFEASYHGHFDVVKWLLSTSADINLRSNFGQSPLIAASQRGHCDALLPIIREAQLEVKSISIHFRSTYLRISFTISNVLL
jgi:ankyrin repeat protein